VGNTQNYFLNGNHCAIFVILCTVATIFLKIIEKYASDFFLKIDGFFLEIPTLLK
jgi:hypothetical protein